MGTDLLFRHLICCSISYLEPVRGSFRKADGYRRASRQWKCHDGRLYSASIAKSNNMMWWAGPSRLIHELNLRFSFFCAGMGYQCFIY